MECQICSKNQETLWFKKCVDCWEVDARVYYDELTSGK